MLAVKAVTGGRTLSCMKKPNYQSLLLQHVNQSLVSHNIREEIPFGHQQKRLLHVSQVRKDMENAFRSIGAGIAITGVIGPGIGIGIVFGNLLAASGRNPSLTGKLFGSAILGAALCETLGLVAMTVSVLALVM